MQLSSNSWQAANPQKKRISYEHNEGSKVLERQRKRVREMFPFKEPYQQQIDSMDQILSCLNERKNLLLECPTGTGKTLMLLTSAFTFIEKNPEDYQILYLTKTHGQVNGLVKELNKILDADSLTSKYAILAGRSQLCLKQEGFAQFLKGMGIKQPQSKHVNKYYESFCSGCKKSMPKGGSGSSGRRVPDSADRFIDVSNPTDLSAPPRKKAFDPYEDMSIASQKCENFEIAEYAKESEYKFTGFSKLKFNKDPSQSEEPRLPDIEDMTTLFKSTDSQCPFYFNRYIAKQANLVFMNYNYLLNPDILKYVSKNIIDPYKKQIIIFDEAHNIEQQAESQFQTKLKLSTLEKLFSILNEMLAVFRLAHTLRISDIVLEQGLELLDQMREQEVKSQRINSKPTNGRGGEDDAEPPYEINLKLEDIQESAENIQNKAPAVALTEKSVGDKAVARNSAARQILSDVSQRKINEPQNKFCDSYQKKNVENSSSTTITSQPKFNCYPKIEEGEEVQQEISSNVSSICDFSQDRFDTSIFLIKTEIDSEIQLKNKVEFQEKEIKLNFTEFLETLQNDQQDLPKSQCEEIQDFEKGQLSQSLNVQEQGISSSDKFEQQKVLMKLFFADYQELFGETLEYIQKLIKFSKHRMQKQKQHRPASHLMSEYKFVSEYYQLFGLEIPGSEESNKENNNVKQEEMKSILDKVNEIFSQEKRSPSKLSENLLRLEQIAEFAPIFILLIRQIKLKFSKLNQVQEIEQILGSNPFCEGNLLQMKVSLNFFANSLRPLKHKINKIKKLSNFMKEMQSFFDLSMIHQRQLKNKSINNVYQGSFNIESEDLKKLQDFYLSIQPKNEFKQNLIFTIGCLSGKYAFRSIQSQLNVHSIILCSGTLAPFDILQKNLDTTFKTYMSSHVIEPKKQLFAQFIKECQNTGEILNFSFQKSTMDQTDIEERNEQNILSTLFVIKDIVMSIADRRNQKGGEGGGVIVFFKSYELMYQFQGVFLKSNLHRLLEGIPKYFESKSNSDFQTDFLAFKKFIQVQKKTCIFFAACRGKLSEGIDLSDSLARSVIVVGMPFWHLEDPYLQSKKKYVQRVLKMDPDEWNRKQVIRCVNQAAGRSIRHIKDWGSIFFICSTFSQNRYQTDFKNLISSWVLEGENPSSSTSDFLPAFNKFLDTHIPTSQSSAVVQPESDSTQNQLLIPSQTDENLSSCELRS